MGMRPKVDWEGYRGSYRRAQTGELARQAVAADNGGRRSAALSIGQPDKRFMVAKRLSNANVGCQVQVAKGDANEGSIKLLNDTP